tara:strand:- start:953 stop:1573 length:621 start_codon:yes stop_codon:yes gene_type:complete
MKTKILLQLILFFFTLLIVLITFNIYFNNNDGDIENLSTLQKKSENILGGVDSKNNKENLIKDIYYISKDNSGNTYEISSKEGKIDVQDPSIIYMTDVTAKLLFIDTDPINISSSYAMYNNESYETDFYENVNIRYPKHNIKTNNMNLSTEKNLATLNGNIFYKGLDMELLADKVEIDLITKVSRIFMDNKYKKVKIIGQNQNGNN